MSWVDLPLPHPHYPMFISHRRVPRDTTLTSLQNSAGLPRDVTVRLYARPRAIRRFFLMKNLSILLSWGRSIMMWVSTGASAE